MVVGKMVGLNVLINLSLMVIFVFLTNNTLALGMEETLVSLILIYGLITVFANLVFVVKFYKNKLWTKK